MTAKTKNILILVLIGIIAALILFTCNGKKVEKPVIIPVKDQVNELLAVEAKINPAIDSFKTALEKEKQKAEVLKKTLAFYQNENKRLGGIVSHPDTIRLPGESNDYYTQQEAINDLLENNRLSDSTCNETVGNLQQQIDKKDIIIDLQDTLYSNLRGAFNSSMRQQDLQAGYVKKLESKVKWTRAGKFGWKAAAIAGGIFIIKGLLK